MRLAAFPPYVCWATALLTLVSMGYYFAMAARALRA
jgi:hypothetical protein